MKKILILGSYGRGNVGDDAFLYVAMKLFKKCKIFINSENDSLLPQDLRNQVTTIKTSGITDIFKKIYTFFTVTHVVYCGGDLWVELYGDKYPRQSLYKMLLLNIVLRIFGKKIAYIGCGAGRIDGFSLTLARTSAKLASLIIVRETHSQKILNIQGIEVLPDLTINLFSTENKKNIGKDYNKSFLKNIGISVMYYIPDACKNYPKYKRELIKVINTILEKQDRRITLMPMLISEESYSDLKVCQEIYEEISDAHKKKVAILNYSSFEDFLASISSLDLVIGTRLHANILSILNGVPSIGIAYRKKVSSFFYQIDMEYFCVHLDSMERIIDIFSYTENNYAEILQKIQVVKRKIMQKKELYENLVQKFLE